jgi:predicted ATP-dependent Lon-type protease
MSEQITEKHIQNKNEEEISKNIQYFEVYRKMVSQMAKNSEKEYFLDA